VVLYVASANARIDPAIVTRVEIVVLFVVEYF